MPPLDGLTRVAGHDGAVRALYPVGEAHLLSVDRKGQVLLRARTGNQSAYLLGFLPPEVDAVAYSQDHALLAYSSRNAVFVESLTNPARRYRLDDLEGRVLAIDFLPDAESVLLGSADSRVYRWNFVLGERAGRKAERDKVLERYVGHGAPVGAVRSHPFGRVFFSGDWSGSLNAWSLYDADDFGGQFDRDIFGARFFTNAATRVKGGALPAALDHLVVSRDGSWLLTGSADGELRLWKVRGLKEVAAVKAHEGIILDVSMYRGGRQFATVGRDGTVKRWEVREVPGLKPEYVFEQTGLSEARGARRVLYLDDGRVLAGTEAGAIAAVDFGRGM